MHHAHLHIYPEVRLFTQLTNNDKEQLDEVSHHQACMTKITINNIISIKYFHILVIYMNVLKKTTSLVNICSHH